MISSTLSRLSVFNNGSVWALYLLHVIIRTALFCSLNILSDLKPHAISRWSRIKLLYKIFNIFWSKNRFTLHIIPSDLDILFDIFCTCPFHVKCWSIVKPKKSKSVTRSIICSFKFSCGIRFSMFRCLWWKIINFVFLTLNVRTAFLSTTGRVTNFPRVLGIRRTFQTLVFRSAVFEMYKLRAAHGRARRFEFRPTIFCMLVN